jgi:DNA-binding NarL/FixJ family response regulator
MTRKYKLLICDDHLLFLDGIVSLLGAEPDFEIWTASNGKEALDYLEEQDFDLCLMDISMPVLNGIETSKIIIKRKPHCKVVILTTHDDKEIIREMLRIGVSGYILKNSTKDELLLGIKKVLNDKLFFSDEVNVKLHRHKSDVNSKTDEVLLTKRETEIIQLLTKEYTNDMIAKELNISFRTVETHRKNIMQKTHSHNLAGLLRYVYSKKDML